MTAVLAAFGLGVLLGVVTGMPLGVINVAVVDAAGNGRVRFATGVGAGGAIADAIHAALAFLGIGRLVTQRPEWVRALAVAAAVVVIAYAIVAWRTRTRASRTREGAGIFVGLSITLPNIGALGAWVAVAASAWPDIPSTGAIALAVGVGLGSATWFALLARWVGKRRERPWMRRVPRVALVLLVIIAVGGAVRAFAG